MSSYHHESSNRTGQRQTYPYVRFRQKFQPRKILQHQGRARRGLTSRRRFHSCKRRFADYNSTSRLFTTWYYSHHIFL